MNQHDAQQPDAQAGSFWAFDDIAHLNESLPKFGKVPRDFGKHTEVVITFEGSSRQGVLERMCDWVSRVEPGAEPITIRLDADNGRHVAQVTVPIRKK